MADKLKIMLVDDHYLVRMGLASIIALEPDMTVCDEEIYGALQAGAMAYLVKSVQREELTSAIRKAAAGQRHIPAEVAARLADRVSRSQLSGREIEVLRLMVSGRRNREIANALDI